MPSAASAPFQDIADAAGVVIWPLVVLVGLVLYRRALSALLISLGGRIGKLSIASISIEFAAATPLEPQLARILSSVKEPWAAAQISDSRSDLERLAGVGDPADYAVIALAETDGWLTSRLYLAALLLRNLRRVRCLVFVTDAHVPHTFVGLASPDDVLNALERDYSHLGRAAEAASIGFNEFWDRDGGMARHLAAVLNEGVKDGDYARANELIRDRAFRVDLRTPDGAAAFIRQYLENRAIWRACGDTPGSDPEWVVLPGGGSCYEERAEWVKGEAFLLGLLGNRLSRSSFVEPQDATSAEQARLALMQEGDFVAVLDRRDQFRRLIDRTALQERFARESVESLSIRAT